MAKRKTAKDRDKSTARYTGTDGIEYRGKAVKQRKRLEARQSGYEKTIKPPAVSEIAFTKPGSMKR